MQLDGGGHVGDGAEAQYEQRMGISAQSFVENRTRSGGEVLIRGEVQPRQRRAGAFEYRYIGVQQLNNRGRGAEAALHTARFVEMLGANRLDHELRCQQRLSDSERVVGLAIGVGVDDDTNLLIITDCEMKSHQCSFPDGDMR